MTSIRFALVAAGALLAGACATVPADAPQRVAATAPATTGAFVVSANPLASEAGMAVLRRGGSAADAALAVQAMLSLVEPQSSGIGGGGLLRVSV